MISSLLTPVQYITWLKGSCVFTASMEWYSIWIVFGSLFATVWGMVGTYNILLFGVKVRRWGKTTLESLGLGTGVAKSYVGWKIYCIQPTEACVQVRLHGIEPWKIGRCYEVTHTANGDEYRQWPLCERSSERAVLPFFAASLELTDGDSVDIYKRLGMFAFQGNTLDEPFWEWFLVEIVGVAVNDVQDMKVLSSETFDVTSLNTKISIDL